MLALASPLVDTSALLKIIIAAFAGGAGVTIAFGLLLLGLSRGSEARGVAGRVSGYGLSALAAVFCIGAVVLGVYAMAKKPASAKPKARAAAVAARVHRA